MSRRLEAVRLIAGREWRLLSRGRAAHGALAVLVALAWLPPLLLPLRRGAMGLASMAEVLPLALATAGVILPLLALLAGTELFAGEIEDGSLVPVVTLPISRDACYWGKILGRAGLLCAGYVLAYASAGASMALAHGRDGLWDYTALGLAGFLLCLSCGGIGIALGAGGAGRVKAFASALIVWLVLVFVVDAAVLTVIVASAPPAPTEIGHHGHDELTGLTPTVRPNQGDDAQGLADGDHEAAGTGLPVGLMAVSPVDLYRLTGLTLGPGLRHSWSLATGRHVGIPWLILITGWMVWIAAPPVIGLHRFRRVELR